MKHIAPITAGIVSLILTLGTPDAGAQSRSTLPSAKEMQAFTDRLYAQARTAIENGQYDTAVTQLNSLIARFDGTTDLRNPQHRVDAALYWKAYSEAKLRQLSEALATVGQLKDKFGDSRWLKDAMALSVEIKQSAGQVVSTDQPDDDLKLLALRGLMQSDPDRAIPMIEQILAGDSSMSVKGNAIFVLSQSRSPRSQEIIGGIAKNGAHPELQLKAIRYLGAVRGADSGRILEEAYRASSDDRVKRSILHSFMVAGDRPRLLGIATDTNSSIAIRGEAIQQLGVLKSDDDLVRIYARETSPELKRRAVQGLFVSGSAARLVELARAEKDPQLKRDIVQKLSLMRSKEATDYMMELLK